MLCSKVIGMTYWPEFLQGRIIEKAAAARTKKYYFEFEGGVADGITAGRPAAGGSFG